MDGQRQMYQGNWTCSSCNAGISELPFQPRETGNLMCRECHSKSRGNAPRREKQMHQGEWTCAGCSGRISQLPFEPRDTSNLKCIDCFKKEKGF